MERKVLFSLTEKDFEWLYVRGSGPGGQKKNKTCSAVHCTHRPSGAHAFCQDGRSQRANRVAAFERVTKQNKFKQWLKLEMARRTGLLDEVERCVDVAMQPANLKCEVKGANGKWVVWDGDTMGPESED